MEEIKLKTKRGERSVVKNINTRFRTICFWDNNTLEPMNIVTPTGTSGEKLAVAYFTKNSLRLVNLNISTYAPLPAKLKELYEFV